MSPNSGFAKKYGTILWRLAYRVSSHRLRHTTAVHDSVADYFAAVEVANVGERGQRAVEVA